MIRETRILPAECYVPNKDIPHGSESNLDYWLDNISIDTVFSYKKGASVEWSSREWVLK